MSEKSMASDFGTTGIDPDQYDHGPGSEEHKRKMAAEKAAYEESQIPKVPTAEPTSDRISQEQAMEAAGYFIEAHFSLPTRPKLQVLQAYARQEPEHPEAEVWAEIKPLLEMLEDSSDPHYLFRVASGNWGVERGAGKKTRIILPGCYTLLQLRDQLIEIVKPKPPTLKERMTKVDEENQQLRTRLAEYEGHEWRRDADMVYSVRQFDTVFRVGWYCKDDEKFGTSGQPGIDDVYPTCKAANTALDAYAAEHGWERVK